MLLEQLKNSTKVEHEALERDMALDRHLRDRDSYRRLLQCWYGWYAPWEAMAWREAPPEIAIFLEDRWKTPMIVADLRYLGDSRSRAIEQAAIEKPNSVAAWIGAMYVLEGSTLGGQVISRLIEERLGLNGSGGVAFFKSYGPQVGARWREFREFAERNVPERERDAAVRSALQTFQAIHGWLCPSRTRQ